MRGGYWIERGLIDIELVESAARSFDAIARDPASTDPLNLRYRHKVIQTSGAPILDSVDPVTDISAESLALARDPRLLTVLGELLGDVPCLFKDKAVVKPPSCPGYAWHQDYIHWPMFPESFVTALIALDQSHSGNGGLDVVKGSHRKGYLSPRDGDFHDLAIDGYASEDIIPINLAPGDVVFFGAFLVHGSSANLSPSKRRHLYLSYNAQRDGGDMRALHYRYFQAWLKKRYSEYGTNNSYFK